LFDGANDEARKRAVLEQTIPPPSQHNANVPAELDAICKKALARDPADRYQSAKVMAAEIAAVLDEAGYPESHERIATFLETFGKPVQNQGASLAAKLAATPAGAAPPTNAAQSMTALGIASIHRAGSGTMPGIPGRDTLVDRPPAISPAASIDPKKTAVLGSLSGTPLPQQVSPQQFLPQQPAAPVVAAPSIASAETVATPALVPTPAPTAVEDKLSRSGRVAGLPSLPPGASLAAVVDDGPVKLPTTTSADKAPEPVAQKVVEQAPDEAADPAAPVSLPRAGTGGDVLAGWGWGTDKHTAITEDSEYEEDDQRASRKRLVMAIGGALGAILLIAVIAMAVGGSDDKPAPKQPVETSAGATPPAPAPAATAPAPAPVEPAPAAVPAEPAPSAPSPDPGSAAVPAAAAAVEPAPEPKREATPEPVKPAPVTPEAVKPAAVKPAAVVAEPAKPEPAKAEPAKAAKVVPKKLDAKPVPAAKKKPDGKLAKVGAPVDPYATADKPKVDPAAAYKTGFQQFVRGDTAGALSTFKGSLTSNPTYPATWRGLGLVYEKLGQKAQAKSAFRRYLQLSPQAPDAEQIRSRMERLGS
jgi:hypothetical protein